MADVFLHAGELPAGVGEDRRLRARGRAGSEDADGDNQLAILVGASREETEAPMRQWLQTEWDVAAWSESTIEHAIRGNAKECVEQLRAHVASGVDRIILIPYRYQAEQVEIIAREILPVLR